MTGVQTCALPICRDGINIETAKARLSSQKPASFYTENSDIVIINNEKTNLREEAERIIKELENNEVAETYTSRKDKIDEGR